MRGGYTLIRQDVSLHGSVRQMAFLQIPLSEGIIDRKYASLGLFLLKDAMRRAPLLFGLGMGGFGQPLPKMFGLLKAHVVSVPFFMRVQCANAVLRNLQGVQRRPALQRAGAALLAGSGLAQAGASLVHAFRSLRRPAANGFTITRETEFGTWLDDIWDAAAPGYSMIVVRNRETLAYWYSNRGDWMHFLCVRRAGQPVGWAAVGDARLNNHNHLGNARLGSVIDCLALPGLEAEVISLATTWLADRKVDLIISNQSDPRWVEGLRRSGYLEAPSNYLFAAAPELLKEIATLDPALQRVHLTRGDGDAAYNLS